MRRCPGRPLSLATAHKASPFDAFFRKSGRIIIPLTVGEILNEQIARKLA
jgi:hypothetical protein